MNFSDAFIAWIHVKVITFARTFAGIIFTVVKTPRAVSSSLFTRTVPFGSRKLKRMSVVVRNEDSAMHWIARPRAGLLVRIRGKFWRRSPGSTLKISPTSHK